MLLGVSLVIMSASAPVEAAGPQQESAGARLSTISSHAALLEQYCVTCHNERLRSRGTVPLELQTVDLATVPAEAELWEKVDQEAADRLNAADGKATAGHRCR